MHERRFPPLLSGPSLAAAALAVVVVLAGLALTGVGVPMWLIARDPSLRIAFFVLLFVKLLIGVGVYLFAAPRMWRFTKRYTPAAQGQQRLPDALLTACLREVDFPCPSCTYNLRGINTPTCPECNTPVVVYLYGTQKTTTKWTALIISWLAVMLITSGLAILAVWEPATLWLRGAGWWDGFREVEIVVIGLTATTGAAICGWRAVALAIPKPPHRQSICVRRTAVWLAALSAAVGVALSTVFAARLWLAW
ncbi:MAG: hypothetical protein QM783_00075 [Phycisphaerales bacterium]